MPLNRAITAWFMRQIVPNTIKSSACRINRCLNNSPLVIGGRE